MLPISIHYTKISHTEKLDKRNTLMGSTPKPPLVWEGGGWHFILGGGGREGVGRGVVSSLSLVLSNLRGRHEETLAGWTRKKYNRNQFQLVNWLSQHPDKS